MEVSASLERLEDWPEVNRVLLYEVNLRSKAKRSLEKTLSNNEGRGAGKVRGWGTAEEAGRVRWWRWASTMAEAGRV